ncbi:MAG: coproporphyrinogen III oxidase [Gammaproteobacteria bacterium]
MSDSPESPASPDSPDMDAVVRYLRRAQTHICGQLQAREPAARFGADTWRHAHGGGGGVTRIIERGEVFEKGGVNFSHVRGDALPAAAGAARLT